MCEWSLEHFVVFSGEGAPGTLALHPPDGSEIFFLYLEKDLIKSLGTVLDKLCL